MKRPLLAVCMCFVVFMVILAFRPKGREVGSHFNVADWNDKTVTITGRVYRKDTQFFYLDSVLIQIQAAGQQQDFSLKDNFICEYIDKAPRIGSRVKVMGTLSVFRSATNPGEFDSAKYYQSLGVIAKLTDISVLNEGEDYCAWQEVLFFLREYFRERLYKIFPDKEASVMTAMLLGDKSELDTDTKRLYQENGIIHILSISGLHITIIGMSIYKLLRRVGVPVWIAAIVGGIVLLFYGVMTGMSVSACRAIGMFLLKMLAEITGRTYDMLTAMGVMAAGMVGMNPLYLRNAGFLLSYGAILGIGVVYPVLCPEEAGNTVGKYEEKKWKLVVKQMWEGACKGLKQSFFSGLAVTLVTLPILLWFYYQVPTYSVFLNLLVIPFMTSVMIAGLLAMLLPGVGVIGTVDCVILAVYEWLCEGFEQLPFAMWNPGKPEALQIVIYYLGLAAVMVWRLYDAKKRANSFKPEYNRKRSGVKIMCKVVPYMVLALLVAILGYDVCKETTVTFLDVGQGDCICIQLDSGEVYLFDCGSTSRSKVGEYVLLPYLRYCGIDYVDAIFVSHPDADHCNGVKELLANGKEWGIDVGALILPDVGATTADVEKGANSAWWKLVESAEGATQKKEIAMGMIKTGDYWEREDCRFLCLHPPGDSGIMDSNVYSQCFYIELEQEMKLLLTGDVEGSGEEMLLAELRERNICDVTVLKVAHHGSCYSTGEDLLQQIQPRVAVISCGEDNVYGHPHEETLERLSEEGAVILTTPEYGAITVKREEENLVLQKSKWYN